MYQKNTPVSFPSTFLYDSSSNIHSTSIVAYANLKAAQTTGFRHDQAIIKGTGQLFSSPIDLFFWETGGFPTGKSHRFWNVNILGDVTVLSCLIL